MAVINIDHTDLNLYIRICLLKPTLYLRFKPVALYILILADYSPAYLFPEGVRQTKHLLILVAFCSIIKNNEFGNWQRYQFSSVSVVLGHIQELIIKLTGIHKFTHRHIRIWC